MVVSESLETGLDLVLGPVVLPALLLACAPPTSRPGGLAVWCAGLSLGVAAAVHAWTWVLLPLPPGSQAGLPFAVLLGSGVCLLALIVGRRRRRWGASLAVGVCSLGLGAVIGTAAMTTSAQGYWATALVDRDRGLEEPWLLGTAAVLLAVLLLGAVLAGLWSLVAWGLRVSWLGRLGVGLSAAWLSYHAVWEIRVGRGALPEDPIITAMAGWQVPLSRALSEAPLHWWSGMALAGCAIAALAAAETRLRRSVEQRTAGK